MPAKAKGRFIDPMLLLRTDSLPNDGDRWEYQLKFDGYNRSAICNAHIRRLGGNSLRKQIHRRLNGCGDRQRQLDFSRPVDITCRSDRIVSA
jgi:hypothetical protein